MTISNYDKAHIFEILHNQGDWFGADLIRLISRADSTNKEILKKAYPDYYTAYENWYHKTGTYEGRED